ncbi:MAG: DUF1236 domain-containing protein [Rhodospirillales bacterium]
MNKKLYAIVGASAFLAGAGIALAQTTTTTTTTWTADQGTAISTYSTSQKYASFNDPNLQPAVGVVLPGSIEMYPLPATVTLPEAARYNYSIINGHPVIVERTTRKVVHTWN